jgi:hypothetical protein
MGKMVYGFIKYIFWYFQSFFLQLVDTRKNMLIGLSLKVVMPKVIIQMKGHADYV